MLLTMMMMTTRTLEYMFRLGHLFIYKYNRNKHFYSMLSLFKRSSSISNFSLSSTLIARVRIPIRNLAGIDPRIVAASVPPSQKTNVLLTYLPESINQKILESKVSNADNTVPVY